LRGGGGLFGFRYNLLLRATRGFGFSVRSASCAADSVVVTNSAIALAIVALAIYGSLLIVTSSKNATP
jgi:hypothetical protein